MGRFIQLTTGKKNVVFGIRQDRDVKAGVGAEVTALFETARSFLALLGRRLASRLTLAWCHPAATMRIPAMSGPSSEPRTRIHGCPNQPGYRLRAYRT